MPLLPLTRCHYDFLLACQHMQCWSAILQNKTFAQIVCTIPLHIGTLLDSFGSFMILFFYDPITICLVLVKFLSRQSDSKSKVPGKHLAPAEWSAGLVPLHPRRSPPRREFINAMQLWYTTRRWCLPLPHLSWTLLSITPFYTLLYLYTLSILYPTFLGGGITFYPFHQRKTFDQQQLEHIPSFAPVATRGRQRHPSAHLGYRLPKARNVRVALSSMLTLTSRGPPQGHQTQQGNSMLYDKFFLRTPSLDINQDKNMWDLRIWLCCSACFMIQSWNTAHDMIL